VGAKRVCKYMTGFASTFDVFLLSVVIAPEGCRVCGGAWRLTFLNRWLRHR
jgi:hypothetical protein